MEDVPAINSYRLQVLVTSQTERGTDTIQVTATHIKEPLAEHMLLTFLENELGSLLGFNLMFPTGSTVEMVVGTLSMSWSAPMRWQKL